MDIHLMFKIFEKLFDFYLFEVKQFCYVIPFITTPQTYKLIIMVTQD